MNIVWIFIDSVRRYYSDDDRSRLKVMDKFKERSIEFTEVVTSAPSTVMSISAMMTGCHSYLLGTNYNDFRFDRKSFPTLNSILSKEGWESKALLMHPDIREKLTCLDIYPRRKWPKNFSHGKWWSNSEILMFLEYALQKENNNSKDKNFWFIDYNCRKDSNISDKVERTLNLFYEFGYNHDNTIFILCSDHGYPDKSRGITPELLKSQNMTHDVFMTDDNIMIPFFISLPGLKNNIKFDTQISTINILPTILDYLNINIPNSGIKYAKSLMPIIRGEEIDIERFARCDARFLGQSNRVTCIRSKNYKLIYSYDENKFSYNQINGLHEKELENISKEENLKNLFIEHKKFLKHTDFLALEMFKLKYLKKLNKIIRKFPKDKTISILLCSNAIENFEKCITNLINEELIKIYKIKLTKISFNNTLNYYRESLEFRKIKKNIFDIKLILQTDDKEIDNFLKDSKLIRSKKSIIITTSLTGEISQGRLKRAFKTIWNSKILYIYEPLLIFKLFLKLIKNK